MWLYDKDNSELAYCLVDTPDTLLEWENNLTIHHTEDIAPELRVTVVKFERDKEKEELIKHKVSECRRYAKWYEEQIINKTCSSYGKIRQWKILYCRSFIGRVA